MRVIILQGKVTGSVMLGADICVRLTSEVTGKLLCACAGEMRECEIEGKAVRFNTDLFDIDCVAIIDNFGEVISWGVSGSGIDIKKMLSKSSILAEKGHIEEFECAIGADGLNCAEIENSSERADHSFYRNGQGEMCTTDIVDSLTEQGTDDVERVAECEQSGECTSVEGTNNNDFYHKVYKELDRMFELYPHNTLLENAVFDSSWIDVEYNGEDKYVVGVICEQGTPTVIAYGVPCDSYDNAMNEYPDSDYLPLSRDNPIGAGYALTYQNAVDGSIISRLRPE